MYKKVVVFGGGTGISYLLKGLKDFPIDITGSLKDSIAHLSKLLDVKHTVLPISEDSNLTLMGLDIDGNIIEGEEQITKSQRKFERIFYKNEPTVLPEVIKAIKNADLIIFSMGSLYTSILPNIICKQVKEALNETKAPIMYLCNIVTQPGETDNFTVGDHVELLNKYLETKKLDVVIANNKKVSEEFAKKYESEEQKDPVIIDKEKLKSIGVELIDDDLLTIDDNTLKHDSLKLSSLIFSYLMRK